MDSGKMVFPQLMDLLPTYEFHQCVMAEMLRPGGKFKNEEEETNKAPMKNLKLYSVCYHLKCCIEG